jgi:hypothetical protein
MSVYSYPSFYAHLSNGILLLLAIGIILLNYKKFASLESYKLVKLFLLVSLVMGVHSLSHLGFEYIHKYNPLSLFIST